MMTVSTETSRSRAFDVRSRKSDSGVVIRMSAASRPNRARSMAGVSPVRIAICRHVDADAFRPRDVRDAGQRRPQVAFDVNRERLERRDVEHAAPLLERRSRLEHEPVEAPEERGQRLAAAGGREDKRGIAARDRRPSELLRPGRRLERRGEPLPHRRVERSSTSPRAARRSKHVRSGPALRSPYNIQRSSSSRINLEPGQDMGDAGEGLVDAESRLAERMEEREEEKRKARQAGKGADPERVRQVESLKLARTEMQRQLELTTHPARKQQLTQALTEIEKRIKQLSA